MEVTEVESQLIIIRKLLLDKPSSGVPTQSLRLSIQPAPFSLSATSWHHRPSEVPITTLVLLALHNSNQPNKPHQRKNTNHDSPLRRRRSKLETIIQFPLSLRSLVFRGGLTVAASVWLVPGSVSFQRAALFLGEWW